MTTTTTADDPRFAAMFTAHRPGLHPWPSDTESPVYGPTEPARVTTDPETGERVATLGRNVKRLGHSPDVIGSQTTSGTPTGWGDGPIDMKPLPRTETMVRRSRKGRTTFKPVGRRPQHKRTVGETSYVDPFADMAANLAACLNPAEHGETVHRPNGVGWSVPACTCGLSESNLVAAADRMIEASTDEPRKVWGLTGDRVTHPHVTFADRSGVGEVHVIRDESGGSYRWAENPGTGALIVSNGELGAWFGLHGLDNAGTAEFGGAIRTNESKVTWPSRTEIPAANRLHTDEQLGRHALASFGKHRIADVARFAVDRKTHRVIGRKTATATELVTFADEGWFVGTTYYPQPLGRKARATLKRRVARGYVEAPAPTTNGKRGKATGARSVTTDPTLTDALTAVRQMPVGDTIHGVTRTHVGRWANGSVTLTVAAAAKHVADAMRKAATV